ncbi:DnaA regulatory inactivator Hda [Simiduia sp. 21SJ11W-1]|uniref:DnaA regulatory inactivator Hda n=1 Tax=Simiduia sp. 21SJ11W-1 TaxID=2909669 RepID=UPI00209CD52C|nr:DnaA regulatory inactivator Hda [Simiduia sp. 21SJ11W-1]UTA49013.1 DnaA regulatory inactivator Hda [Simiduia sp. 21SJ11W-1]
MALLQQLPLGISLNDDARFDNFYLAEASPNAFAVRAVRDMLRPDGEQFVTLWGGPGRSHLAQALCVEATNQGWQVQYLPLRSVRDYAFEPEAVHGVLAGLEQMDLVCLDDVDTVAGIDAWELGLFHLFNRLRDAGVALLITSEENPAHLRIALPDLQSRLQWGLSCQLHPLTDAEKALALTRRAEARGLQLPDEVANFIIQRMPRDMNRLFGLLEQLDRASLQEKRKLTIPFVKQVLGQ